MRATVVGNALLQKIGYCIVQINEEKIPLSSGPKDTYYFLAITGMVVFLLMLTLARYLSLCRDCRKRICELDEQRTEHPGWNLWQLKRTIKELEMQKTDDLIGEMKKYMV